MNQGLLAEGLQQYNLASIEPALQQYLALLDKWGRTYNLTAVRDEEEQVKLHLLDSLAVLPWLHGQHILDVGTGAGLPGIPLALARPDCQFTLLDSNGKKTRFLQEVRRVLGLKNLQVVQSRVERYQPNQAFDTVLSRAFADLKKMLTLCQHLVADKGIFLAMKGKPPAAELADIDWPHRLETYPVLGLEAERCCIIITRD